MEAEGLDIREARDWCVRPWVRWTVFMSYPDSVEEIDLDALPHVDELRVMRYAKMLMERDYEPGGKIRNAIRREGMYL